MRPHTFTALKLSKMYSSEYEPLWDSLRTNLKNLVVWQQEGHVRDLPLLELSGIGSSKSRGPWKTLKEFGMSHACQSIPRNSDSDFEKNLLHSFPKKKEPFRVWKVWWNGRTYWMNDDGSHHAAAAYVQALEQKREISIPCAITHIRLDEVRATQIAQHFFGLVVIKKAADRLSDALYRFGVPFQYGTYTPANELLTLLFLPRSSRRATFVAETLLQLTAEDKVFNFTQFIFDSIATRSQ